MKIGSSNYINYNVFTLFFTTCIIDLLAGNLEYAGYA